MSERDSYLSPEASHGLLGIEKRVPLSVDMMAANLRLTFFPDTELDPALETFARALQEAFAAENVKIVPYEEALAGSKKGRVREGITLITLGEGQTGNLASDHISSLYLNPVVGIFHEPSPVQEDSSLQAKLDAIVGVLAWQMVHVAVFVDGPTVTICTMNGAVVALDTSELGLREVARTLIPKLTALVVPPRASDIDYRYGALDSTSAEFAPYIDDFLACGRVWAQSQAMMSHTSVDSLDYRSPFYKRIVSAYLDQRSGMSYGFFAWQLPTPVERALTAAEAQHRFGGNGRGGEALFEVDGRSYVRVVFRGVEYVVAVPDVWVLSTRSGCNKFFLNPETDIVRMGLKKGRVLFDTPRGIHSSADCKPSYDTLTILSHAVANALAASILLNIDPDSRFVGALNERGLSLTHWHDYPEEVELPAGYVIHGTDNPSVSCSTPQSALYALLGKFRAVESSMERQEPYLGDVHIEPHHGTNIIGVLSLAEIAEWHYRNRQKRKRRVHTPSTTAA